MKRDMDLVRDILICFVQSDKQRLSIKDIKIDGKTREEIAYHIELMKEVDMLHHQISKPDYGPKIRTGVSFDFGMRPTMKGCDFLDSVKDPEVWRKTKSIAHKAGGGSIEFFWGIAKELIKGEIKRQTGIDVG